MKWKCKSCKQIQESCFLGFFSHNNFNCDKCVEYIELMNTAEGKKSLIKKRDDALHAADEGGSK